MSMDIAGDHRRVIGDYGKRLDEVIAERNAAKAEIALVRRIVALPLEQTLAEVKHLEPGNTASACQTIDLWNKLSSAEAGTRINRELRAEVAKLRQACEGVTAERDRAVDMAISVSKVQRSDAIQHRWVTIYSVLGREFREQGDARAFALNWLRTSTFPVSAPATAGEGGGAS